MRTRASAVVHFLAALLWLGCGAAGPSETELAGTWHANKIEYISTSGLGTVDIMTLGAAITLQLNPDKTAAFTFTRVGGHVDAMTGTWTSSADVLTFTIGAEDSYQWDMSMNGTTLQLTQEGSSWDFNGDGVQEPAIWRTLLSK